ncbi:McrB family protein [Brachyspira pilosicoli]|uniref:McrB family protein n=1 Tax=Brachyspira pilosicoli TaxID=52584 RepID=UPI002665A2AB|nr:AAA family ATPase [Brachyspira pilosicoli]
MASQYNKELINLLKTKNDIVPENHDGSYVLIPKVISILEKSELKNLDYKDLDAIYFLCIGDWRISLDKRIKCILNSNLEENIKNQIKTLIDEEKNNKNRYFNKENDKVSYGLFGTGNFTFKQYESIITQDEILKFFKLIIGINNVGNTNKNIYDILKEYKDLNIKGLKKGSLSQFLHCIKPNVFPILNSIGKNIYKKIGVEIDRDDSFSGYINDIKNINKFMEENNFNFKNYRVIDLLGLEEFNMNDEITTLEIIDILKQKKQIILQGAPGTGKTYITSEVAVSLIDGNIRNDRKLLMNRYKELIDRNQIFFTTFHQSMDYEEFVEGFKPVANDDNIYYEVKDGIFKEACNSTKTAGNEEHNNPVVLIIDEINRGNIAKIFGELITLLESDKRTGSENEIKVILPYSKEVFSVPNNLYIIGTMNTTDRSIGYIDYALRRRFAFIPIKAQKEKIENYYEDEDLKKIATDLFDSIEEVISENLNDEFDIDDIMIGHSYFMAKDIEELNTKLNYEIKPLLLEYLKDGILQNSSELKNTIKNLIIE